MSLNTMNFVPPMTLPLPSHNTSVKIGKFLGPGATGLVYASTKQDDGSQVVVKFMREPNKKKDFQREAHILRTWHRTFNQNETMQERVPRFWAESYDPVVSLSQKSTAPGYLIMTQVLGRKVTSLLGEHGPLEERLLVRIGLQFAEVLDGLHTQLGRTFTDLKLENIWWLADKEEICVTDWNVISEEGQTSGISHDLDRWGRMLFQMLTGIDLETRGKAKDAGFSKEELQRLGGHHWQDASVGVRDILTRALHPNPKERYSSAKELADDLRLLDEAQHNPIREVSLKVQEQVYAEGDELRHALWMADSAIRRRPDLGIITGKLVGLRDEALERVETQQQTTVAQFATSLRGGNFDRADQLAKDLIKKGNEALTGHRLQRIAIIARNQKNTTIDRLVGQKGVGGLLGLLEKGQFAPAIIELESVKGNTSKQKGAKQDLNHDLTFCSSIKHAEAALDQNQLDIALSSYDKAQKAWSDLNKFPTQEYAQLLEAAYGQPTQLRTEAEKRRGAETDKALLASVVRSSVTPKPKTFREALRRLPDNREVHQALFNAGVATLKNKEITEALEYAKLVPLCVSPDPSLLPFQRTTWALHHAEMALKDKSLRFEGVSSHLQAAQRSSKQNPKLENAVTNRIKNLLAETIKSAKPQIITEPFKTDSVGLLGMLEQAARDLKLSFDNDVKNALDSVKKQQAKVQEQALLSALSTTYSKAHPLLHSDQPDSISIDSMRQVIQGLNQHLNGIQSPLSPEVTKEWKQLNELDEKLTKLSQQLNQLRQIEQEIQALDKPAPRKVTPIQSKLNELAKQEPLPQVRARIKTGREQLIDKELDGIEAKIDRLSSHSSNTTTSTIRHQPNATQTNNSRSYSSDTTISDIQRRLRELEGNPSTVKVQQRINALREKLEKKVNREKHKDTIQQYEKQIKRDKTILGQLQAETAYLPVSITVKTRLLNTARALLHLDEEHQQAKQIVEQHAHEITGIFPAQFMAVAQKYPDKEKPADESSSDEAEQASQPNETWQQGIQKVLTAKSLEDKKSQANLLIGGFSQQTPDELDQAHQQIGIQLLALSNQIIQNRKSKQKIARSSLESALLLGSLAHETQKEIERNSGVIEKVVKGVKNILFNSHS